jgi:hypothetical protein
MTVQTSSVTSVRQESGKRAQTGTDVHDDNVFQLNYYLTTAKPKREAKKDRRNLQIYK